MRGAMSGLLSLLCLAATGSAPVAAQLASGPSATTVSSREITRLPSVVRAKDIVPIVASLVPGELPGSGPPDARTEIVCSTQLTNDGKPVRGVRGTTRVHGFTPAGTEILIGGSKGRSNGSGFIKPFEIEVSDPDLAYYEVSLSLAGRKRLDTVSLSCQHRSYIPCPPGECFGPDNRFQIQCIPDGFFFNTPNEFENGSNERWTIQAIDRCKDGAIQIDFRQTFGSGATFPADTTIVDWFTGDTFPSTADGIFTDGFESGDVSAWSTPCGR